MAISTVYGQCISKTRYVGIGGQAPSTGLTATPKYDGVNEHVLVTFKLQNQSDTPDATELSVFIPMSQANQYTVGTVYPIAIG